MKEKQIHFGNLLQPISKQHSQFGRRSQYTIMSANSRVSSKMGTKKMINQYIVLNGIIGSDSNLNKILNKDIKETQMMMTFNKVERI